MLSQTFSTLAVQMVPSLTTDYVDVLDLEYYYETPSDNINL